MRLLEECVDYLWDDGVEKEYNSGRKSGGRFSDGIEPYFILMYSNSCD